MLQLIIALTIILQPFRADEHAKYEVLVFLHDECVISQYYTIPLNELHEEFEDVAEFSGIFPNPQVDWKRLRAFEKKYDIDFQLRMDHDFRQVKRFGATITPEVFVVDHGEVLYSGRIDNAYARVGKKRAHVTSHELRDVLQALREKRHPHVHHQPAIGCIITELKSE